MILNIQYLRAFAAINVVFLHVLIGAESYNRPAEILSFFGNWGANGVDIFFVISGFVMIYTQINNPKNILTFYKSRLIRIVPIYWIITTFIIFLYYFFPEIFKSLKIDIYRAVSSFLFLSQPTNNGYPIINIGWTLEWEMLFYLIFGFSIYFKKIEKVIFCVLIMMITIFTFTKTFFFLEFFIGVLIGYIHHKFKLSHKKGVFIFIIGFFLLFLSLNHQLQLTYDRLFIWGLPASLIVFGAVYTKSFKNKLLYYLGNASYSIYLVQILTVPGFYKLISYLQIKFQNDILSLICLILSITFGCFFHTYVEKKIKFGKR